MAFGLSPVIPLQKNEADGFYVLTKSIQQNIKQNIKNIFLTSPGERVMLTDFGVGIRSYLFENNSFELQSQIKSKIKSQIKQYMSYVKIDNIEFIQADGDEKLLGIRFFYSVPELNFSDLFEVVDTID